MTRNLTVLLFGLLLATAGSFAAFAEEGETKEDPAQRALLAEQDAARKQLTQRLFRLLESYAETLDAAREVESASCKLLAGRLRQLQDAIANERMRKGIDKDLLVKNLAVEQKRHTTDVVFLQHELSLANEVAEANRLEAIASIQRAQVAAEQRDRLRGLLIQGIRIVGEHGSAGRAALPWLAALEESGDALLAQAAEAAEAKIRGP